MHRPLTHVLGQPKVIINWHIKSDLCIYQTRLDSNGNIVSQENSSRVVAIHGPYVQTATGSRYLLTGRDPKVKAVQELIAPPGSKYAAYTFEDPLTQLSLHQLLYAEKLVYGEGKAACVSLLNALTTMREVLKEYSTDTEEQFVNIHRMLSVIGIAKI
jgi:hypothetical protein